MQEYMMEPYLWCTVEHLFRQTNDHSTLPPQYAKFYTCATIVWYRYLEHNTYNLFLQQVISQMYKHY